MAAVNGGSLEDCCSNVFALTELNGLKWRCFVTPANTPRGVPIPSDCVLKAYGKCLQEGIICTWRRKPPTPPGQPEALQIPSFTNDISKELWVFWFGQEPEKMTEFTSALDKINNEDGAEISAPIPYEVRTLFFKALHTVIERVLMKMGVLRLGRWFTKPLRQPMSGRHHLTPQYCMAFNMQFFVHGGNTVCMTFNPQRQPTLIRLAKRHLDCGKRVQVILSPWSLRAHVLPPSEAGEPSRGQGSASTQYEEWKEFIPLEFESEDSEDEGPKTEDGLPKMVTVEISGVRMLYPTPLICLTLDEDVLCQKTEALSRNHSPMTPEELKVDETKRRNPLLISEISGNNHFQGVVQSVHISRRQPQPPATPASSDPGFREPYPVSTDDETRWNFVDPGASSKCGCDLCTARNARFEQRKEEQERQPPQPRAPPREHQDASDRLLRPPEPHSVELLRTILRRQGKRKSSFIYHRRWKGVPREESPPPSPLRDSTDEEDNIPDWATVNREGQKIGIFINGEASTHYGVASPNSSDDENFSCSPFTPVKCISPCTNCEWPSAPAEQIPEPIFCQIFQPGTSTPIPNASQEERARVYDYYYNPTLREDPYYMSYHNRRQGEKRRSSYPPPMDMPPSPDQPGSQETIPATTSPPPELDTNAMRDGENSLVMARIRNMSVSLDKGIDEFTASAPVLRKKHNKVEWNNVLSVDWSCSMNEEDVPPVDAHSGFLVASSEEAPDAVDIVKEEENEYNPMDASTSVEFMEVDSSVENILSPPASNEQPVHWQRVGGPPSVPDAAMNQIYPTPPSVQQVQIKQEPDEEPMEVPIAEQPDFELVEYEPDEIPNFGDSKLNGLLGKLDGAPIKKTREKVEVSASDRFSLEKEQKLNRPLRPRKDMPPDYQKMMRSLSNGSIQKNFIEAPAATPLAVALSSNFHSSMTPIGQIQQNTAYTLTFVPGSAPVTTPGHGFPPFGPRPGMRQMPPGYATPNPYSMGYNPNMPNQMPGQMGNYMNPMYSPMGQQMGGMGMGGPPMSMGPPGSMGPMNGMGPGPMGQGPSMGMYGQGQMMPPGPMMNPYSMDANMMPPMPAGYMGNQYGMNNSMGNPMQPMRPQHLAVMNSTAPNMYMPGNQLMPQNKSLQPVVPAEKSPPEASSIVLAIILQDTILDLHYDSAFDACPICSCNVTIRTTELGLYISPPDVLRLPAHQQQAQIPQWSGFASSGGHSNICTCGFSSVRHRYLSFHSGLFPEDAKEATGIAEQAVTPVNNSFVDPDPKLANIPKCFLDASNNNDRYVLNQLRLMCIRSSVGKIINHLSVFYESVEKAFRPQDEGADIGSNAEYIVSQIDSTELLLLGNSVVDLAMTPSRALGANKETPLAYTNFFHQWGLQVANEIREPRESEWRALLSEISPALETSMKIVRCASGPASIVEGPLTWKALSSKRQKASQTKEVDDDSFLPEPIPQVLIATEKDLIRASPQVVRMWEQLSLGPVDQPKDVLYLTVIPDNSTVHEKTVKYMEQLSQLYERMRLGRHIPLCAGEVRDGIVRAGGRSSIGSRPNHNFGFLDLVGKHLDDRTLITRLRLYTQQLEETISKVLRENEIIFNRDNYREQIAFDNRAKKLATTNIILNAEKEAARRAQENGDSVAPSVKEEGSGGGERTARTSSSCLEELLQADNTPTCSASTSSAPMGATSDPPTLEPEEIPLDDYGALPHVIVIYMVNPFTWDSESRSSMNSRVAMLALIRAFNAIASHVKPENRTQLHLEIISLEQIADLMGMCPDYMNDGRNYTDINQKVFLDGRDHELIEKHGPSDTLKSTALSVYSAPRVLTPECVRAVSARTMTRFGPGSHLLNEINDWQRQQNLMLYNIPCSPFHLAPHPSLNQDPLSGKVIQLPNDELVLNVTYCLIGGDFLCAAITDEQGRLTDNCLINIRPKAQSHYRYRAGSQILDAIFRLMAYIQGVITMEVRSWRLVIGRLGKMGHGEFKAWNYFLSKSYLRKLSSKPKENCNACFTTAGTAGMPTILSACLISIEPEPFLRVFPSYFSPDAFAKNKPKNLSTPSDVSSTHIMAFTMNTSIDFSTGDQAIEHDDVGFDDFTFADDLGDEFQNILGDVGSSEMDTSDGGSNQRMYTKGSGLGGMEMSFLDQSGSESVQNQPLASGFYVSTAPAGDLPDWFWASCPSAKRRSPVHLKASLHINNQSAGGDDQGDEFMSSSKATHKQDGNLEVIHPLDNQRTDEVLRHVLETYNALSWLNVDATTGDRHSCLPIHIQSLLRLYHSVARVYF